MKSYHAAGAPHPAAFFSATSCVRNHNDCGVAISTALTPVTVIIPPPCHMFLYLLRGKGGDAPPRPYIAFHWSCAYLRIVTS